MHTHKLAYIWITLCEYPLTDSVSIQHNACVFCIHSVCDETITIDSHCFSIQFAPLASTLHLCCTCKVHFLYCSSYFHCIMAIRQLYRWFLFRYIRLIYIECIFICTCMYVCEAVILAILLVERMKLMQFFITFDGNFKIIEIEFLSSRFRGYKKALLHMPRYLIYLTVWLFSINIDLFFWCCSMAVSIRMDFSIINGNRIEHKENWIKCFYLNVKFFIC